MKKIEFVKGAEPFFGKYKKNILNDINFCLKTGNLSNGRFVNKFEEDFDIYSPIQTIENQKRKKLKLLIKVCPY